jgi:hypothetical protein
MTMTQLFHSMTMTQCRCLGGAERDASPVLLEGNHRADVVLLDVVSELAQTLPPHCTERAYRFHHVLRGIFVSFVHRVGRVLSFLSSRRNWDYPSLSPRASVPPSLRFWGGGAHSLAREGVGESQFRQGDIHCLWYSINICTLWFWLS